MNRLPFGHDDRLQRLQNLYRSAEQGEELHDIDPELQRSFDGDQRFMRLLGDHASRSGPASPAIGRARLLAAVAGQRSQSPEQQEAQSMIGRLLTGRALALLAAAGVFAGGAVTVGASGGFGAAADHVSNVFAAAHITSDTHDSTATPSGAAVFAAATGTASPEATNTEESAGTGGPHGSCTPAGTTTANATGTPAATDTPSATNTPAPTTTGQAGDADQGNGAHSGDCVRGIPATNPNHQPAADGTCVPGDTIVKTTPAGVAVNVPCQSVDHPGHAGNGTTTPEASETPGATETTDHGNKGGNSGDHSQSGSHRP